MSGNYIHIAPPEAYNQVYNYYQRVIGDGGTLIDGEAVNRIYHNLNLLNLENRSYKLYHASAGLQKTDDQIDKIYDLGKNDVDQTFSGSDRPEHVQAWSNKEGVGNWQISVEKEATNYCKESNDLGRVVNYDTPDSEWLKIENKGKSPFGDINEAVEVHMGGNGTGNGDRIELEVNTSTTFSAVTYLAVSFYAKKISGTSGTPRLFLGVTNNSYLTEYFKTNIGEWQYFEYQYELSSEGELVNGLCRIQDNNSSADTVYQFWGMQIEKGQYATSRIHTDGGIATRLAPHVNLNNVLSTTQGSGQCAMSFWLDFYFPDREKGRTYLIETNTNTISDIKLFQPDSNEIIWLDFFNVEANAQNDNGITFTSATEKIQGGKRHKMFILLQWNNGLFQLYWGMSNGNLYLNVNNSYDPSYNLNNQVDLPAADSNRYYNLTFFNNFLSQSEVEKHYTQTGKKLFSNFNFNKTKDVVNMNV